MSKEDPKYKKLKNAFLKEFYRAAVENAVEDISPVEVLQDIIAGNLGAIGVLQSQVEVASLLISSIEADNKTKTVSWKRGK